MRITDTVKESYEWGYAFGEAGYQPLITAADTDEQRAGLVGYIDGLFGKDRAPDTALDRPASEDIPGF